VRNSILGVSISWKDDIVDLTHFHFKEKDVLNKFGHVRKQKNPSGELLMQINVDLMRILTIT
jgi:hypothetical protein